MAELDKLCRVTAGAARSIERDSGRDGVEYAMHDGLFGSDRGIRPVVRGAHSV